MINRSVSTIIDKDLCIGCGLCVKVCPLTTISMQDGKAVVTGKESLSCGHCAAACPEDAIRVMGIDEFPLSFSTFKEDQRWLKHGDFDTAQLVRLMRSGAPAGIIGKKRLTKRFSKTSSELESPHRRAQMLRRGRLRFYLHVKRLYLLQIRSRSIARN